MAIKNDNPDSLPQPSNLISTKYLLLRLNRDHGLPNLTL
jgi:hypothetical protein